MKQIKIKFSDLPVYSTFNFWIINPSKGIILSYRFVQFDGFVDFGKGKRPVELVFPLYPILNAFEKLPIHAKNSHILRISMKKLFKSKVKIVEWEVIEP